MSGDARPVIIVGAEPRKVVTIARSLHRAGVRCLVANPRGESLRVSSRAIAGTLRLHGDVAEQAEVLARLARSEGAGWVVPTSDETLQVVSAAYRELSRSAAVGAPPPPIVHRILDKSILFETARIAGVPAPLPATIARAGDLESALPRLRFPLVARPRDSGAKSAHEFKRRIFASADELRATFATQSRFGEGLLFHPFHAGQSVGVEVLLSRGALGRELSASAAVGESVVGRRHGRGGFRGCERPSARPVVAIAASARMGWRCVREVSQRQRDRRDQPDGCVRALLGLAAARHRRRHGLSALRVAAVARDHPCPSGVLSTRAPRALDGRFARARRLRVRVPTKGSYPGRRRDSAARHRFLFRHEIRAVVVDRSATRAAGSRARAHPVDQGRHEIRASRDRSGLTPLDREGFAQSHRAAAPDVRAASPAADAGR